MPNTFRIGITMAGAISAGAYTAGFVDYLIETLDKWERARLSGVPASEEHKAIPAGDIPPHLINIEVISGTSAGGMVGALSFFELHDKINHIRTKNQQDTSRNRLYNAWVEDVDISHMLETGDGDDIDKAEQVESFLNSAIIEKIADKYTSFATLSPQPVQRSYVSDNLEMLLTISNLRGIPYHIQFNSNNGDVKGHDMTLHRDRLHFELSRSGEFYSKGLHLQTTSVANWDSLRIAAMATGAFPFFLLSRIVSRSRLQTENRTFYAGNEALTPIPPAWPEEVKNDPGYVYRNITVDGGLFQNEAFELTHQRMLERAGRTRTGNPREYYKADTAVIMIDPFPNIESYDLKYDEKLKKLRSLIRIVGQLLSSMMSQLLFKIEDIQLANDSDVYSRFLVVPTRSKHDPAYEHPIACGSLGGFGGFLSEEFRKSDFQLGRKNCQDFLRYHFVIPIHEHNIDIQSTDALRQLKSSSPVYAEIRSLLDPASNGKLNPLFLGWTPQMVVEFGIIDTNRFSGRHVICLPIIPDTEIGRSAINPKEYAYPENSFSENEMDVLRSKVKKRVSKVIGQLIKDMRNLSPDDRSFWQKSLGAVKFGLVVLGLLPASPVLLILYLKYKKDMIDWIMQTIKDDLVKVKLHKE